MMPSTQPIEIPAADLPDPDAVDVDGLEDRIGSRLSEVTGRLLRSDLEDIVHLGPLTLLAATTRRTKAMMVIAIVASFSVLPDGTGLVRSLKFPGAPLVTAYLIYLGVRFLRRWARDRRSRLAESRRKRPPTVARRCPRSATSLIVSGSGHPSSRVSISESG